MSFKNSSLSLMLFVLLTSINFVFFTEQSNAKAIIYNNIKDLSVLEKQINSDKPKKEDTLVIFDIDDTLLESANFVGSGKWYNWQRGRKVLDENGEIITIDENQKFHCMFRTLGTLFEIGSTKLTQNDAVKILDRQKKYDLIILTARTAKYRVATERELKKHNIDLSKEHFPEAKSNLDFQFNDGNRSARVTYKNGLVMASGLNKGLVLENLLNKMNRQYKNIYFIDDSKKNIVNMESVWKKKDATVKIFHYTNVNKSINQNEIAESDFAKKHFDQFLNHAFPDQLKAFKNNRCN